MINFIRSFALLYIIIATLAFNLKKINPESRGKYYLSMCAADLAVTIVTAIDFSRNHSAFDLIIGILFGLCVLGYVFLYIKFCEEKSKDSGDKK